MKNIYDEATELHDETFVLATIMSESGSTPRSTGAKMIVKKEGSIIESIGGGQLEAQCIAASLNAIKEKKSKIFNFNLTSEDAAVSEMICGGFGEILLHYIEGKKNKTVLKKAAKAIQQREKGFLVTCLGKEADFLEEPQLFFLDEKNDPQNEALKALLCWIKENHCQKAMKLCIKKVHYFIDPLFSKGTAYLFGGGHVAKETAKILTIIGFETLIIDDREEFANKKRFPDSKIILVDSLERLPQLLIDDQSYLLIMTRGHLYDREVLKWALKTSAYYIGMIGSRRKIKLSYEKLLSSGVNEADLSRVHAPIGIKLAAQTPAEIAVSIAAELINCRNQKSSELISSKKEKEDALEA